MKRRALWESGPVDAAAEAKGGATSLNDVGLIRMMWIWKYSQYMRSLTGAGADMAPCSLQVRRLSARGPEPEGHTHLNLPAFQPPPPNPQHYPHFYHMTDKFGRPLYIELLGHTDAAKILEHTRWGRRVGEGGCKDGWKSGTAGCGHARREPEAGGREAGVQRRNRCTGCAGVLLAARRARNP